MRKQVGGGKQEIEGCQTQQDHDAVAEIAHSKGDARGHCNQDSRQLVRSALRRAEADQTEAAAAEGHARADVALDKGDDEGHYKGNQRTDHEKPLIGAHPEGENPRIEQTGNQRSACHQEEFRGCYRDGIDGIKHLDHPFCLRKAGR